MERKKGSIKTVYKVHIKVELEGTGMLMRRQKLVQEK